MLLLLPWFATTKAGVELVWMSSYVMIHRRALYRKAALEKGAQKGVEGLHSCNCLWRRVIEKLACKVPFSCDAVSRSGNRPQCAEHVNAAFGVRKDSAGCLSLSLERQIRRK